MCYAMCYAMRYAMRYAMLCYAMRYATRYAMHYAMRYARRGIVEKVAFILQHLKRKRRICRNKECLALQIAKQDQQPMDRLGVKAITQRRRWP